MIPFNITTPRNNFRAYGAFFLICVSIAFFVWEVFLASGAGQPIEELFADYAFVPCEVHNQAVSETLIDGLRGIFFATSFTQFLLNMLFLWLFAPRVEAFLGHRRFVVFFLAMGFGGYLFSLLFNSADCAPIVGPNGAIAGVLAAFLFLYPAQRVDFYVGFLARRFEFPALLFILIYLSVSIFGTEGGPLSGNVAPYWDEVGGFISGLFFMFVATMFKPAPKADPFRYLDDD
jgi:membrane associated rhomboid family serine protease